MKKRKNMVEDIKDRVEIVDSDVPQDNALQSVQAVCNDAAKLTTTEAIEIGHASAVLRKAYDLVCEAYDLINGDEIARKYLDIDATVTWNQRILGKITEAYDAEFNKDGEEVYHLRAFDAWKLQYPMCITTSGRCETSG